MRRNKSSPEARRHRYQFVGSRLPEMNRMDKAKRRLEFLEKCPRLQPPRSPGNQIIHEALMTLQLDDLYELQKVVIARDRGEVFPLTERQAAAQEKFEIAASRKCKLAGYGFATLRRSSV